MITPEALTRIEEYCNKATPGPWAVYGNKERQLGQQSGALVAAVAPGQQIHSYHGGGVSPLFDQEFIANARQDIPLLISSLREAQERVGKLEEALRKIRIIFETWLTGLRDEAGHVANDALETK